MAGFMKFLIYFIFIVIWIISNLKKQGKWEEELPKFPKEAPSLPPLRTRPVEQEPHREGLSDGSVNFEPEEKTDTNYDELLAFRRKKNRKTPIEIKPVQPAAEPPLLSNQAQPETLKKSRIKLVTKKHPYRLQSNLKEGIIWSVILGASKSKLYFDTKKYLLKR